MRWTGGSEALVLGIETSCDETSAAVVRGGRQILSNVVAGQDDLHAVFGGVVPEIASRRHTEVITLITHKALHQAQVSLAEIDLVAVTQGPGLIGSLLVGVSAAKGYAAAYGIPLVGVNHLQAHVMANFIAPPGQEPSAQQLFPTVCLLASGGHTSFILMRQFGDYQSLGETRDDAAGEALDKVARLLELGYPGGPAIEQAAAQGNPNAVALPRPHIEGSYDCSFAGLKTALARQVRETPPETTQQVADLAASFQQAVVETLVGNLPAIIQQFNAKQLIMGGGVAANQLLRQKLAEIGQSQGIPIAFPPLDLCTDNAAMVAAAGYFQAQSQGLSALDMDVFSSLPLPSYDQL